MSVRCGNHPFGAKVNHATVLDVIACYAIKRMVAEFRTVGDAQSFLDHIKGWPSTGSDIARTGRVVTWSGEYDAQYESDLRETAMGWSYAIYKPTLHRYPNNR
jgi:hypothetical protein